MLLVPLLLIRLTHGVQAECKDAYRNIPGGLIHTACKPPNNDSNCKKISAGVPTGEKKEILETHNKYRSQVASGKLGGFPAATNMYQILWDDELADVAQAHANQCAFGHDSRWQRFTTKFKDVGQNLAYSTTADNSPENKWSERIDDWFSEHNLAQPSLVKRFTPGGHGHFTQVIWAKTQYIGCGLLKHGTQGKIKRLFACNYGPAGNFLMMPVYDSSGAVCSKCPAGTMCKPATGLCGPQVNGEKVTGTMKPSATVRISSGPSCFILAAVTLYYNTAMTLVRFWART